MCLFPNKGLSHMYFIIDRLIVHYSSKYFKRKKNTFFQSFIDWFHRTFSITHCPTGSPLIFIQKISCQLTHFLLNMTMVNIAALNNLNGGVFQSNVFMLVTHHHYNISNALSMTTQYLIKKKNTNGKLLIMLWAAATRRH